MLQLPFSRSFIRGTECKRELPRPHERGRAGTEPRASGFTSCLLHSHANYVHHDTKTNAHPFLLSDSRPRIDHSSCPFRTSGDFRLKALQTFCFDWGHMGPLCESDFRELRDTCLVPHSPGPRGLSHSCVQLILQRG